MQERVAGPFAAASNCSARVPPYRDWARDRPPRDIISPQVLSQLHEHAASEEAMSLMRPLHQRGQRCVRLRTALPTPEPQA
jgi:hypothetical protein